MAHKSRITKHYQYQRELYRRRRQIMTALEVTRNADKARQAFNGYVGKHAEINAEFIAEMDHLRRRIELKYIAYRDRNTHELPFFKKVEREVELKTCERQIQEKYHLVPSMREMFSVYTIAQLAKVMSYWEAQEKLHGVHIIDANKASADPRPYWKRMLDIQREEHPHYERPKQYFLINPGRS